MPSAATRVINASARSKGMRSPEEVKQAGQRVSNTASGLWELANVWYNRLIGEPLGAADRIGGALTGQHKYGSPEDFTRDAIEALMSIETPTAFSGKPDPTKLSIFGGGRAKTADLPAMSKAAAATEPLKGSGVRAISREVGRQKFGWFKGKEGKWKFEIDDSGMALKKTQGGVSSLADMVDHPELFKAYPQLKNINTVVHIEPSTTGTAGKYVDKTPEKIHHSFTTGEPYIEVSVENAAQAKDILIHEIQHAVQEIEGFGKGGSPVDPEGFSWIPPERFRAGNSTVEKRGEKWFMVTGDEEMGISQDSADRIWQERGKYDAARDRYVNLPGEIEAREATSRRTLTPEQRRKTRPTKVMKRGKQ